MNSIVEARNIGKNFVLGEFSIIRECVAIGDDTEIREFCIVGCLPITFSEKELFVEQKRLVPTGKVVIGNRVFINSHCDIVRALKDTTIIEDNVIIGQCVIIGHESHVHKNVKIMNSVILNGYATIKEGTFIGPGAIVRNRITIGKNCLIGQGSNVVKDIPDNVIAYGNPCVVQGSSSLVNLAARKIRREVKKVI